ncbi:hypothetical protein L7F22_017841 [Adiantum nelumboides]|nr:hypothetical protein [Adiantum nelumboides]
MHAPSWLFSKSTPVLPRIALILTSLILAYSLLPLRPPAFFWSYSDPHLEFSSSSSSASLLQTSNIIQDNASAVYRNAPWKALVGQWLSRCDGNVLTLRVQEPIFYKTCPEECSHRGICNHADGTCSCFHGYNGPSCKNVLNLECNLEALASLPYGRWVVSICSAHCDKTRSMCFCGSGTKYPNRPVAEACGFTLKYLFSL